MMDNVYKILGSRLREERLKAGLTLEQLGEMAGITAGFVSHIEASRKKPTLATACRLAKALGMPISHLINDKPMSGSDHDMVYIAAFRRILKNKKPLQKRKLLNVVRETAGLFNVR